MEATIENLKANRDLFHVQETIGGWRQNSIFEGTYQECQKFMDSCFGYYHIVSDNEYVVDYL